MAAGHHEDDREQAGDRERVDARRGRPEPAAAARVERVEVAGHPVGVDDRDDPVEQDEEVEDEDAGQDPRREDEAEQVVPVHPEGDARPAGRSRRIGRRGEPEGALVGAGIGMSEPGKEQGEERGGERRRAARPRLLRVLHRG